MIADGRHIVIYDGRVLKTDAWIKFHPGGDKSIKHMVGRDATDEINAYGLCSLACSTWTDRWFCFAIEQATLGGSPPANAVVSDWTDRREMDQFPAAYPRREVSPIQQG